MTRGLLHSLRVQNFGILGDVDVGPLGRLNVLVGPNGSGKSTLLRVIQFLGDAAREQLESAVEQRGGLSRMMTRTARVPGAGRISIQLKASVTRFAHAGALDEYSLVLRPPRGSGQLFSHWEEFTFKRTANQGRRITLRAGKLHIKDEGEGKSGERAQTINKSAFGLALLPQLGEDEGSTEVQKIQQLITTFRVFDVDATRARRPSDVRESRQLRSDASNLAAFLAFLRDQHPEVFKDLVRDAREIVPGLTDIQFRVLGGAQEAVAVEIVDRGLPGTTPLGDASFGTIRALSMLAMLYDPDPPLLTCVEEIDHGFHPHVFDRLVELLRVASERTQFIIATHSPALVNRLKPSELIICERDEASGLARIPAANPRDLARAHAQSGFGLGELWFSGTLGGVPK